MKETSYDETGESIPAACGAWHRSVRLQEQNKSGRKSEARDAISRYIYTGLQSGSIMKGWMKKENEMICCCSDGTRPVIFKVERIDYED